MDWMPLYENSWLVLDYRLLPLRLCSIRNLLSFEGRLQTFPCRCLGSCLRILLVVVHLVLTLLGVDAKLSTLLELAETIMIGCCRVVASSVRISRLWTRRVQVRVFILY